MEAIQYIDFISDKRFSQANKQGKQINLFVTEFQEEEQKRKKVKWAKYHGKVTSKERGKY